MNSHPSRPAPVTLDRHPGLDLALPPRTPLRHLPPPVPPFLPHLGRTRRCSRPTQYRTSEQRWSASRSALSLVHSGNDHHDHLAPRTRPSRPPQQPQQASRSPRQSHRSRQSSSVYTGRRGSENHLGRDQTRRLDHAGTRLDGGSGSGRDPEETKEIKNGQIL